MYANIIFMICSHFSVENYGVGDQEGTHEACNYPDVDNFMLYKLELWLVQTRLKLHPMCLNFLKNTKSKSFVQCLKRKVAVIHSYAWDLFQIH